MITQHAAMTRTLGEQLGLPDEVLDALGAAYETWDGRGWPGELKGEDIPLAARIAQLAEFVEVAYRAGGVEAAKSLARERAGKQFDPELGEADVREGEMILAGLDDVETWDAVIDAEPALAVVLSGDRFDAALLAIANFVDLKSPYSLGHSRAVADLAAAAGAQLGLSEAEAAYAASGRARARPRTARGLERDLGQARAARRRRVGARAPAPVSDRADAPAVGGARAARRDRGTTPRAPRRLGLPARAVGRPRSLARRGSSARPTPTRRCANRVRTARRARPTRRQPSSAPRSGPVASTPRPSRRFSAPPAIACAPPRGTGRSYRARGRGPETARPRAVEQGDRQAARDLAEDAGNHVEHIYSKIGASTRAEASLFAMQHGLLPEEEFLPEAGVLSRDVGSRSGALHHRLHVLGHHRVDRA